MYRSLGEFIGALERTGELVRVRRPVDPLLEISAIADRVSKGPAPSVGATGLLVDPDHAGLGGPALLFENVQGSVGDMPVAINLFGSYRRMEMALGCTGDGGFEQIARRIADLTRPSPPHGLWQALRLGRKLLPVFRSGPRLVSRGPCQEVVVSGCEVNLLALPIIKCWPLDGDVAGLGWPMPQDQPDTSPGGGRFITFAGMHTIHADDADSDRPGSHNIGMYRAQVIDRTRLAMHWHIHHDGASHWRSWKRKGQRMPIAIAFGAESVLPYAATCPLPPGINELIMAGFLNGASIPLVRCKTVPLRVPANSEIIIEGWVSTQCGEVGFDPRNDDGQVLGPGAVLEGPFGDHTGFYSLPDRYPIMEVTAITRRRQAIFPATIVGLPPQEDYYLGKATERIMLPLLKILIPDIVDYDLPMFGCFHNCAVVQIRKEYAFQARRVMHAVWGAGQMAWTKVIIVVDHDVEVHRLDAVLGAVFSNVDFVRDVEFVHGPLDILDHSARALGAGSKMGFDATRKVAGEGANGVAWDARVDGIDGTIEQRASAIETLGAVGDAWIEPICHGRAAWVRIDSSASPDEGRATIEQILAESSLGIQFVIAVGSDVDVEHVDDVLLHWCANCDMQRDAVQVGRGIGFDARAKERGTVINGADVREYPPVIRMDGEMDQRVTERWSEYGLDGYGVE